VRAISGANSSGNGIVSLRQPSGTGQVKRGGSAGPLAAAGDFSGGGAGDGGAAFDESGDPQAAVARATASAARTARL
jgi:hypothetical protein